MTLLNVPVSVSSLLMLKSSGSAGRSWRSLRISPITVYSRSSIASWRGALIAMFRSDLLPAAAEGLDPRGDRDVDLPIEVRPAHEAAALLLHDADDLEVDPADPERLAVADWCRREQPVPDVAADHADAALREHVERHEEAPESPAAPRTSGVPSRSCRGS